MESFPKYEHYKDSGLEWLGKIPKHWEVRRHFGLFDERKEVNHPDMELLSVTIERGVIKQSEITVKKDSSNEDKSKYKVVRKGDLAYNKMRMWQGAIGMSEHDGIVSPAYIILKLRDKAYSRFFHYLFRTASFIREANRYSYGLCDDMNSLRYEDFKTMYSPIPPKKEAKRIAAFIDQKTAEIDEAIEKKQRLIELLKEQKAILINQAVTKGLDPNVPMRDSGVEWVRAIPAHWKISRIGFIGIVGNGSTPNRSNESYWRNGSVPWLNSSKVNDGTICNAEQYVTEKAVRECHLPLVPKDSIVLAITGEGKTRGMAAVLRIQATINQHLAYIKKFKKNLVPEYLHFYLQAMYERMRYESSGSGSTKGAITCHDIRKYNMLVPPLKEQQQINKRIADICKVIDALINKSIKSISSLGSLKQIIISNTVTGKIKI